MDICGDKMLKHFRSEKQLSMAFFQVNPVELSSYRILGNLLERKLSLTSTFANIFSLKSFPLYDNLTAHIIYYTIGCTFSTTYIQRSCALLSSCSRVVRVLAALSLGPWL